LKATKVDGIYDADPMLYPAATRYDRISYLQVLEQRLKVMDATAISLCMDNHLPIVVFNLRTPGNIKRAIAGQAVGSVVTAGGPTMDVNDLKGLFAEVNQRMNTAIDHLRHELAGVRTGRASSTLLDNVHVDAYGSRLPLNQVAGLSV